MASRKKLIGLAALLAVAISVPAFAQPVKDCPKPSNADSEAAHLKYIAGKVEYDEGNYDVAIKRFRDAYALDCQKHDLLIIISAAHEKKGDKQEAVRALEEYLRLVPGSPDAGTYRARIENLKKQIAATPPPTATATATTAPTGTPPPPPSQEMQEHTVYPWVLVGIGAGALIVGVTLIVTAPDLPTGCDKNQEKCTPLTGELPGEFDKRQQTAGRAKGQPVGGAITAGLGGALVVAGLLWHFLEPTGPKEQNRGKLQPVLTPSFGGLSYSGTF